MSIDLFTWWSKDQGPIVGLFGATGWVHTAGMLKISSQTLRKVMGAVTFSVLLAVFGVLIYPSSANDALSRGYYGLAWSYLDDEATTGDARAQNALANLYYLGLGGEKNQTLAAQWYRKSAAQGHSPAQVNFARMYRLGLGVKRDVIRSLGWLLMARSNGNERAELWMRAVISGVAIPPNQVIMARERYRTLDALLSDAKPSP